MLQGPISKSEDDGYYSRKGTFYYQIFFMGVKLFLVFTITLGFYFVLLVLRRLEREQPLLQRLAGNGLTSNLKYH